jgi:hypothetical protein
VVGPSIIPLSVHYLTDEKDIRRKFDAWLQRSNAVLMAHGIGLTGHRTDRLVGGPYLPPPREGGD